MAHVKVNEAQQNGAFNNGAVGQQSRALCPYPYVWDRVRKACVLPDEFAQVRMYQDRVPMWNWLSYLDWPGALPTRYNGIRGLGANCPEGSGRTAAYTGPEGPDGCRCSPGRVWHNGYCQSPESVVQQSSAKLSDYASMTVEQQMAQPLSDYAKQYFQQTRHTVNCKLVYLSVVPGGPNYPTMMCSIDGGPYEHGAYAINLNPGTAITSAARTQATAAAIQQGVPTSAIGTPESQAAITVAVNAATAGGAATVDAAAAATAQQGAQLRQQLIQSLVRGMDIERPDGRVSWRAAIAYNANSSLEMVQEALKVPPGFFVGEGVVSGDGQTVAAVTDYGYSGTGIGTGGGAVGGGGLFDSLGDIPWWVWAGAAVGGYMVMKGK